MKAISVVLALVIGIAMGALGYHFLRHSPSAATRTEGLRISHSTSDPERVAMETIFAYQYARLHRAKDLEGLMAMGKFEGVWENILSSKKRNLSRSFAQEITEFSFREAGASEISGSSDLSLTPLLKYTVSLAQPNPEVDTMRAYSGVLGIQAGRLYMVDRVKRQ